MPSGLGGYATSTDKRGSVSQPAQPQPSALGENEWEKGPPVPPGHPRGPKINTGFLSDISILLSSGV